MLAAPKPAPAPARSGESKPYHHGDLRRALLEAALRVLDREGPGALSLRAVAREAGVSPAAPYHHFKDKSDLIAAVAASGFDRMYVALKAELDATPPDGDRLTALGLAFVCFARENPALYQVMGDCQRDKSAMPEKPEGEEDAFSLVLAVISERDPEASAEDVKLAAIAAWCAAHGLAEMGGFDTFTPYKAAMGGERAFFASVLSHLGMFNHRSAG